MAPVASPGLINRWFISSVCCWWKMMEFVHASWTSNSLPGHNRHEHAMTLKIIQKSHSSPLIIFIHWSLSLCKLHLSFIMRRNTTIWRQCFDLFLHTTTEQRHASKRLFTFHFFLFINSTTILQASDRGGYYVKYDVSQLLYKNESMLNPCLCLNQCLYEWTPQQGVKSEAKMSLRPFNGWLQYTF